MIVIETENSPAQGSESAEQLLPGVLGVGSSGSSPGFGYRSSPSRPRIAYCALGGEGDLNLAEYKQLAVAAKQRIAGRRRMAANKGVEQRSMSPDERRKARSMFGRGQAEKTQQLEQKHARQDLDGNVVSRSSRLSQVGMWMPD
eukprot:SAG22_NODE_6102_length_898_cov_1.359199_1_plen_143_part_10